MSTDLMLVTRRAPTMADLRAAVKAARRESGLGTAALDGDWGGEDLTVGVTAEITGGEPLVQLFRPSVSRSTAANPYTVDLGLAPPIDADGQCWLTAASMSGQASDEQVDAALAVVRALLLAAEGHLVVNGAYVALDGVPEPQPAAAASPPEPPRDPPPPRTFWQAFLPTPALDEQSWPWAMELVRDVHAESPQLRPRLIELDGEWRPLLPSQPVPPWWPTGQKLLTAEPYVTWSIDGAFGPGDRCTDLQLSADLDPAQMEALLPRLVELARDERYGLWYGLVHAWHPEEPNGPSGLVLGQKGRPRLSLNSRYIAEEWLPNLYWAQVFGPPWVELFGAGTLASTPAHRVEEIAADHWLIQLTEHLADVVDDHAAFQRVRMAARAHLGDDAFYSPERGLYGTYRRANVPTLEERGLVPPPPAF